MRRRSGAVGQGASYLARNNDLGLDQPKNGARSIPAPLAFPFERSRGAVAANQNRYLEVKVYHIPGKIAKTIVKRHVIGGSPSLNIGREPTETRAIRHAQALRNGHG
jgi:hypothetical protein